MGLGNGDHDDYLLYLIYQMDENSLRELLEKYGRYNRWQLRHHLNKDELIGNEEDCLAELNEEILKAVYSYRPDQETRFSTYYRCFFQHYIANYRRQFYSYQGRHRKQTLSLDHMVNDQSDFMIGQLVANKDITLEGIYFLHREQYDEILKKTMRYLRPMERKVILMKLEGYTYEQICDKLLIDYRQVEYILAKVRKSKALID